MEWTSELGTLYEQLAIDEYARRHPNRIVIPGHRIPPTLLAKARGMEISEETIHKDLEAYALAVQLSLDSQQVPPTRSQHFGMDGVDVDAQAFKDRDKDTDLNVIEVKSSLVVDCNVLGPSIARQFCTASRVGFDVLPPLKLIAPQPPTPMVFETFSNVPNKLNVEVVPRSVVNVPQNSLELASWQRSMVRQTRLAWKGE